MDLFEACHRGRLDIVQQLLESKANPNINNNVAKSTPLVYCRGHIEIVQKLLEFKAEPNMKNAWDSTALHHASINGYTKMAQKLLEFKAEPNIQDEAGNTALFEASYNGRVETIQKLLEFKADPNIQNTFGNTALFEASYCAESVKKLLDFRADPTIENKDRQTVLDITETPEIQDIIRQKLHSLYVSELTKLVIDSEGNERSVFPFPTAGGHHLLFQEIAEFCI